MRTSITMPNIADQSLDIRWTAWIRQVARGDNSALASFYDASKSLVYSVVFRILGDVSAAQEVTLDVYLQVWRQACRFDSARGRPATWLMVMARSRALDKLRARSQEFSRNGSLEDLADTQSGTPGPEEIAVVAQQQAQVRMTLKTLSDEQRQPIELAYFGGLSQSEIASQLNQPLGTIKTRMRNGLLKLREKHRSRDVDFWSKQMSRKAGLG